MNAPKTIGVIGLGSIGARHAGTLVGLGHPVLGHDVAILTNAAAPLAPWSEILERCDAVVIASPTKQHLDDIGRCIGHRKPMFVEKPIGTNAQIAAALLDMAGDLPVFVGYMLRFHSSVIRAKEWLDAGDIGTPLWANLTCAQFNDKPAYLRDGVILNWSHEIDLALYLLGPGHVSAAAARIKDGCDDLADIVIEHESGARSAVHLDYLTQPEVRQTMIVGDKGMIIMDLVHRQAWLRDSDGGVLEHHIGTDSFDQNYVEEMQAFLDRIDGKETLGATGADGLAALQVCLDARRMAGLP